jgi:hypothetical protein
MFHIVNPETTWMTSMFSSGFTIANIFFTTANQVEMMLRQTPHQSSFAIFDGLSSFILHKLHRASMCVVARSFPQQRPATSRAV